MSQRPDTGVAISALSVANYLSPLESWVRQQSQSQSHNNEFLIMILNLEVSRFFFTSLPFISNLS